MVDVIELVRRVVTYDDIGAPIEKEIINRTYCEVKSITQNEYYKAKEQRINVKYCLVIKAFDYNGEAYAYYKGTRYNVVRTYATGDSMELYLGD